MIETNRGVSLVVTTLTIIVIAIIGFFVYQQFFTHSGRDENINFTRDGNIVINNPGLESDIWYLIYETPGNPANNIKLTFNVKSICRNDSNSCADLIAGERVSIKGIESNGTVLVREVEFLDNTALISGPVGVDWEEIISNLNGCQVDMITINTRGEIYLLLKSGSEIFSIEPNGILISNIINQAKKKCGAVPLVSE